MKPQKAIEILDIHQCDMPRDEVPNLIAAIKLGIEALKRVIHYRKVFMAECNFKLPGETEK